MGSDAAWKRWGETDPHYAVLSSPEYRSAQLDANLPSFFQSGEEFIAGRLAKAQRLFGNFPRARALDFGCGVGRLVIPLARHFDEVVGVDVSPAMLRQCQTYLAETATSNVVLAESDDTLSRVGGRFSFVNSYIVLQHIPVVRGMNFIARLIDLADADGGVVSLQMTIDRADNPMQKLRYWAQRHIPGVQAAINLATGRSYDEPLVEMNEYQLPDVLRLFSERGADEVSVDIEHQGRVLSVILMARRGQHNPG